MEPLRLPVHLAGRAAARQLRAAGGGRVAALFKASFYIETEAGFICIGNADLEASPLSLVTAAPAGTDWSASGLRLNAKASISAHTIGIGNRFTFLLGPARAWSPEPMPLSWGPLELNRGVKFFQEASAGQVPAEGLGRFLLPSFRPARDRSVCGTASAPITALRRWLTAAFREPHNNVPELRSLHRLMGLGPGLTPSGDDVIGGVMIALQALGETVLSRHLWAQILSGAEKTSNPISRAHLKAASEGEGSAPIHRALAAIVAGAPEKIEGCVPGIDRIGHTSGWDIMAGIVVALESWLQAHGHEEARSSARVLEPQKPSYRSTPHRQSANWRTRQDSNL